MFCHNLFPNDRPDRLLDKLEIICLTEHPVHGNLQLGDYRRGRDGEGGLAGQVLSDAKITISAKKNAIRRPRPGAFH